uniref:MULE transposase domain-containing protein n=2 Tax=Ciona intestinalis TaxID=7719 RepID=H2XM71_CIOIN
MTDKCEAEINAVESSFQDCKVLLCDFHREQAWERWVKKTDNGVGDRKKAVLSGLRAVAKAENMVELKSAVDSLTNSEAYTQNAKLQTYFQSAWLPQKERWVSLYRLGKMRVPIGTNNGVERQNKMLKE